MEELDDKERLELAIEEVNTLDKPCYADLARKYFIEPSMLSRRYRGVTVSKAVVILIYKKILIDA
jgi:hypothetical protein